MNILLKTSAHISEIIRQNIINDKEVVETDIDADIAIIEFGPDAAQVVQTYAKKISKRPDMLVIAINNGIPADQLINVLRINTVDLLNSNTDTDTIISRIKFIIEYKSLESRELDKPLLAYFRELEMRALLESWINRMMEHAQKDRKADLLPDEKEIALSIKSYFGL